MVEFLLGVDSELIGDVHVLRALEHLRVDDVGDDGLIFARRSSFNSSASRSPDTPFLQISVQPFAFYSESRADVHSGLQSLY